MPQVKPCIAFLLTVLSLTDASAQWSVLDHPATTPIYDVQFVSPQHIRLAAGEGVFQSSDGGSTWTQSTAFTQLNLQDPNSLFLFTTYVRGIHFFNALEGFAVGWSLLNNNEIIAKTIDGGVTWTVNYAGSTFTNDVGLGLTGIQFLNSQTGYASSFGGRILKTMDAGQNWTVLNVGANINLIGIQFFDTNNGIAFGGGLLFRTTNGGTSWTQTTAWSPETIRASHFIDVNNGFASLSDGRLMKTTNGGATWSAASMTNMYVSSIAFTSSLIGYAAGNSIYKTTDGGLTWYLQKETPYEVNSITFLDTSTGFAGLWNGEIQRTLNAGEAVTPPVSIVSFSPATALPGYVVQIDGTNLPHVHTVLIGGIQTPFSIISNSIHVTVPVGAVDAPIELRSRNGSVFSSTNLVMIKNPLISFFSPSNGIIGSTITIQGTNFTGTTSVKLNSTEAVFTVQDNSTILVTVPPGSATGRISVTTPFGTVTSSGDFAVYPVPIISSITPGSGYRDGYIYVAGPNLASVTQVSINGVLLSFSQTYVEPGLKIFGLPANAITGKITVANPGASVQSAQDFVVLPGSYSPTISSFSPTSGKIGQMVTLQGTGFYGMVKLFLDGQDIPFQVISNTEIVTEIPYFGNSGRFALQNWAGDFVNGPLTQFIVQAGYAAPVITGFTPAAAIVGTEIVVNGSNFYDVAEAYVNGERADYVAHLDIGRLRVGTPANGSTGKVTLIYGGNLSAQSAMDFTVIKNYCIRPDAATRTSFLTVNKMQVGNQFYSKASQAPCLMHNLHMSDIVEAKPGEPISILINASTCNNYNYGEMIYMIYVDKNDDQDFDDPGELLYYSQQAGPYQDYFDSFTIPSDLVAGSDKRMRIGVRPNVVDPLSTSACDFAAGVGLHFDYTMRLVNDFTHEQPIVSNVSPTTVTHGTTVMLSGQHLVDTEKIFIDGIESVFTYNPGTTKLEVIVPPGANIGTIDLLSKGGPLRLNDALFVVPAPLYTSFTPLQGIVGATVQIQFNNLTSAESVTNVFFGGAEAQFTRAPFSVSMLATVPANAQTGKISFQNQFGIYETPQSFTVMRDPVISSVLPSSGRLGDPFIINGSEFYGASSVKVNNVPAYFTMISPTQLSVRVPHGSSSGSVSVTNQKSTFTTVDAFTVLKAGGNATLTEIPSVNYQEIGMRHGNNAHNRTFDFNSDGLLDIVANGLMHFDPELNLNHQNHFAIYPNNGDGTFGSEAAWFKGYSYDFGDFNGDGLDDIIVTYGSGFYIYYNQSGSFSSPPVLIWYFSLPDRDPFSYTLPHLEFVGDYDNDGDLDVAITGSSFAWLEQNNGAFTIRYVNGLTYSARGPYAFDDFNMDGQLDFVQSNKIWFRQGNGYVPQEWLVGGVPDFYQGWTVTDFNQDGQPDLLGSGGNTSDVYLSAYRNLGGSGFARTDNIPIKHGSMRVVDLTNSGLLEILSFKGKYGQDNYALTPNKYDYILSRIDQVGIVTPSEWMENYLHDFAPYNSGPQSFAELNLFDFENDGDLDLVHIFGANIARFRVFENNTVKNGTGPANAAPTPPTLLTFERITDTEAILKWNSGNDDRTPQVSLSYNLRVRNNATGKLIMTPRPVGSEYGNAGMRHEYQLINLDPTVQYSFDVQVIDHGYRASSFSAIKNFKTAPLPKPTNLIGLATGTRSINLTWIDNSNEETTFVIEYRKTGAANYQLLAAVPANTAQFMAIGLDCHQEYEFRVQTADDDRVSVFSDPAAVTTLALPDAAITGELSFCEGESTVLTATPGFDEYLWTSGASTESIEVFGAGGYSVTVKDPVGCEKTIPVVIIEKARPTPTIDQEGNRLIASGGTSYEWYKDGTILSETSATLNITSPGTYMVKTTVDGCQGTSDEKIVLVLGLENNATDFLRVFPNPTKGVFTLLTSGISGSAFIVNSLGVQVHSLELTGSQKVITLDFSTLPTGLYSITYQANGKAQMHRFVVQR